MKKRKSIIRMFTILLTALLLIPCLLQPASASETDEAPVFFLQFSKDGDYVATSAFLLEDTHGNGGTYLVTTNASTTLVEQGYSAELLGVYYGEEATYLTTVGNVALYYAPGLEEYTPLKTGTAFSSTVMLTHQGVDSESYITGPTTEFLDISGWTNNGDHLVNSGTNLDSTMFMGAPVLETDFGGVVGIYTRNTDSEICIISLLDVSFPADAALYGVGSTSGTESGSTEATQGGSQSSPAAEEEEEGQNMTIIYIVLGVAAVAVVLFLANRKSSKKSNSGSTVSAPMDSGATSPMGGAVNPIIPDAGGAQPYQGTVPLDPIVSAPDPIGHTAPVTGGATAPAACWQIRGVSGLMEGRVFLINGTMRLGRSPQCDVVFPKETPGVSGTHCELSAEGDRVILRDLQSTYGTYLSKGVKMEPGVNYYLQLGDVFTLAEGGQSFRLENVGASVQELTPVVRSVADGTVYRANMDGKITFGRDPRCQVSFEADNKSVSGSHCVLYREGDRLYLMDTGSTNGTFFSENQRLRPNVPYKVRKGMSFFLVSAKYTFVITEE